MTNKPAPADLGVVGRKLWREMTAQFEFHSAELALLHQLAATTDEISSLKAALTETKPVVKGSRGQPRANPLLAELRNHRKLADQLTVALALPTEGEAVGRRRRAQAKQAADAKWRKAGTRGRTRAVARQLGCRVMARCVSPPNTRRGPSIWRRSIRPASVISTSGIWPRAPWPVAWGRSALPEVRGAVRSRRPR